MDHCHNVQQCEVLYAGRIYLDSSLRKVIANFCWLIQSKYRGGESHNVAFICHHKD